VRRTLALGATATSVAALIAGCGSSGTSSTKAAAAPATSAAQSTPAATSASSSSTETAGVMVETKHAKLGTILAAGSKQLTVYLFEGDKGAASSCTGGCAQVWPPVTTTGEPKAAGGASAADLATITRPDGTKQVTYKGHPLYFFARDGDKGDAYGQGVKGFGADWYVLAPSGRKVDKS
jgi:predicted lipoprotein with Yx(FWY)xxD motif